jgi:hypothetical protein
MDGRSSTGGIEAVVGQASADERRKLVWIVVPESASEQVFEDA